MLGLRVLRAVSLRSSDLNHDTLRQVQSRGLVDTTDVKKVAVLYI
jgi:hypothetical protein